MRHRAGIFLGLAAALGQPAALAAQEAPAPASVWRSWNQLDASWIDLQLHITAMLDGAFFSQNAANVEQVGDLGPRKEFRLENLELDGQLLAPFPWRFQIAAEYDGADQKNGQRGWSLSDLNVSIPLGRFCAVTIGNQSEGVTLERLASSEDLSFMERSTMSSALTIPRNTGVRFTGTAAGQRINWSAGWYNGWLTNVYSFSESGNVVNARVAGLPVDSGDGRRLVHLGVWGSWAEAQAGAAHTRSRPEVYEAPYFVDTGSYPSDHGTALGFELAAVHGPVTLTAEYTKGKTDAAQVGDPSFSAWYVQGSWALTGETRPYNRSGGYFGQLQPFCPFTFKYGGPGAFEAAVRYSWIDLDSKAVRGGKFDRISGALSWFATGEWRVEFNYGYGRLERFGLSGRTHFYQLRLQWEI